MPQRTRSLDESFVPQDGVLMLALCPSLIHVDQRQRIRTGVETVNTAHRASNPPTSYEVRELLLRLTVDRKV